MTFNDLMQLTPTQRAQLYRAWATEVRDEDPELAVLYDATAAELEFDATV